MKLSIQQNKRKQLQLFVDDTPLPGIISINIDSDSIDIPVATVKFQVKPEGLIFGKPTDTKNSFEIKQGDNGIRLFVNDIEVPAQITTVETRMPSNIVSINLLMHKKDLKNG